MCATAASPWKKKAGEYRLLSLPHQPFSFNLKSYRLKLFFYPFLLPPSSDYESSQGPDKKKTVYQMALSKKSLSPLLSYSNRVPLNLEGTRLSSLGPFGFFSSFFFFLMCSGFVLYLLTLPHHMSLLPCLCFVVASDKLDEILAAAQHTITSDSQGQKGHGGKRDRSKSIVSNEVRWEFGNCVILSCGHTRILLCCFLWPSGAVLIITAISVAKEVQVLFFSRQRFQFFPSGRPASSHSPRCCKID